jgi:ZIP family zinc transporter
VRVGGAIENGTLLRRRSTPMGQALVFGLIGSSALVIGGAIGAYWRAPHQIIGVLLAFAGGAVLASLADTLMPEAFEHGRPLNSMATASGFLLSFILSG